MKVVILAAGMGSRLGAHEGAKSLVHLFSGKSILQYQLETLSRYLSLDQVILVVGYQKEVVLEAFPNLLYVYNPKFAIENTSKSLWRAMKKCEEEVLWINGDVVFHPLALEKMLNLQKTSMLVAPGPVSEEEVKYRQDAFGKIIEVSKITFPAEGEALGINFCSREDLPLLCQKLEACAPHDYFEKAIEMCLTEGMAVSAVPVSASLCIEIDFPEDLERANQLLQTW